MCKAVIFVNCFLLQSKGKLPHSIVKDVEVLSLNVRAASFEL